MNDLQPGCTRRDDVVLLAYGELSAVERHRLLAHLESCAACRTTFAELVATRTAYEGLPAPGLGAADQARFLKAVPSRPAVPFRWMLAAAAALAAIAYLAGATIPRGPDPSARLAVVESELRELRNDRLRLGVEHPSAIVRLEQVQSAGGTDEVIAVLLDVLAHDPSPNVRLAALDALGAAKLDARQAEVLMSRLLSEPSPILRSALIEFITDRELEGREPLLRRLERSDEDPSVRDKARTALERQT